MEKFEEKNKTVEELAKRDWDKRHGGKDGEKRWGIEDGKEKEPEKKVIDFFAGQKEKIKSILDVACGPGRHVLPLAQMGFEVSGVDFSKEGLKRATERLKEANLSALLKEGSFHSLPFNNESFDAILSTDAINRNDWAGAKKTFREIARVLKTGGFFYLRVRSASGPIKDKPEEGMKIIIKEEPIDPELNVEHRGISYFKKSKNFSEPNMHAYSEEELLVLAKYVGLEVFRDPVDEKSKWDVVFQKIEKVR